ncbi:8-oxo-dGTPase [Marinobacter daqiaonensis]|uniref:8-oxo-dGTP diphosphatase n=1 Tax=Marinobacter daqiaonensis TaxID=650891 RepID=A0A1I6J3F4_9GAMM|nr:Nudix family hydrolase [Marinobacter daqiaonensis]SFR73523.1 8-oxo-dGTPase [Marinobacter daqiaonensis]
MTPGGGKLVHVAVGVVWRRGRVLVARRPEHAHQGGLLEFPGGKVEAGESVQHALARELLEETAVKVDPASMTPLIRIRHDYGDKEVLLDVWQVHGAVGEPSGLEGQPVFWLAPEQLSPEAFPVANRPIISALRLPDRLAITGNHENVHEALTCLASSRVTAQPELIVLRLPSLPPAAYAEVVTGCIETGGGQARGLLVHDHIELAQALPVAGLHLSWRRAVVLVERPVPADRWFGVSCHSGEELDHAAIIGADYATLGPVLPTPSHPQARGMGWDGFAAMTEQATLPVYALGGTAPDQVALAKSAGGQGIAGISWWWQAIGNGFIQETP